MYPSLSGTFRVFLQGNLLENLFPFHLPWCPLVEDLAGYLPRVMVTIFLFHGGGGRTWGEC